MSVTASSIASPPTECGAVVAVEFIRGMDTVGMEGVFTASAGHCRHRHRRMPARVAWATVACIAGLLGLPACSPRHAGAMEGAQASTLARATAAPALAWTVNATQVTPRITTTSLETRQALPGYQFVVLDVSVRNRDTQPRVLSEGALVAMDETGRRRFDQPETLLSDDYLSLQVLAPAQQLRGKIAFEVPAQVSGGVLFWHPGDSDQRILLNPMASAPALADVQGDADAAVGVDPDADADANANAGVELAAGGGMDAAADVAADSAIEPDRDVDAHPDRAVAARSVVVAETDKSIAGAGRRAPATGTAAPQADTGRFTAARTPTTTGSAVLRSATARRQPPPGTGARVVPPTVGRAAGDATVAGPGAGRDDLQRDDAGTAQDASEQARLLACQGLVARDDPRERDAKLGFFARSCRDFALPSRWQPEPAPRRSLFARASALMARIVLRPHVERIVDCSSAAASDADRLVCADPDLAAMDHRLAQSVTRAREQVDDPSALQREQAQWRGRVLDACRSARCLEQAYGQRIGQLDALASTPR